MKAMPKYRLYEMKYCPYCVQVRKAAGQLGVELEIIDVLRDESARDYLYEKRGRGTVPVLGIVEKGEERLLGESRDIIRYLKEHTAR